jgi:hypothetical protein
MKDTLQVEVEVQSNAYGPSEGERVNRAFRGGHAAVHRAAETFIGGVMRHVPHEVEAGLKNVLGSDCDDVGVSPEHPSLPPPRSQTHREGTVLPAPESARVVVDLSAEPDTTGIRQDEEDGWVSEHSGPEDVLVKRGHRQTAKLPRNRTNKRRRTDHHRSSTHVHNHSRLPLRAAIDSSSSTIKSSTACATGSSTMAQDVPSPPVPEVSPSLTDTADEEPRGRRLPGSALSTSAGQTVPRHMRIISLRGGETGSREVSPARSIRWADAGTGAGPATARWTLPPSAQGSRAPSPGPPTPGERMEASPG